jgi:Arc/MetJ-type ribon-helix-helix transcriptional regulator
LADVEKPGHGVITQLIPVGCRSHVVRQAEECQPTTSLQPRGTDGEPLRDRGMVTGMASKKVTITLDEAQLDRIRALVHAGTAPTVSGFIQHAVAVALDDVAGWGALLAEALRETGGALSDDERTWADEILGVNPPSRPAA